MTYVVAEEDGTVPVAGQAGAVAFSRVSRDRFHVGSYPVDVVLDNLVAEDSSAVRFRETSS